MKNNANWKDYAILKTKSKNYISLKVSDSDFIMHQYDNVEYL